MTTFAPAVVQNPGAMALAGADKRHVQALLELHGAVVLRGYAASLQDFEAFTRQLGTQFHVSATRAALRQAMGDNYSTEVWRDNFSLLGHTEGSYRPDPAPPELCFFLCQAAPSWDGGETLLVDGVQFLQALPASLCQRLQKQGIIYEMTWLPERWQAEFNLDTEEALRAFLDARPDVRYTLQHGRLHLFYSAPAITTGRFGQPVFATGLLAHLPAIHHERHCHGRVYVNPSNRVYFGDGQAMPETVINTLIDIHDRLAHYHRWQTHDLVVVDNTRVLHGRTMTSAPCERSLLSRFGRFPVTRAGSI